ncbi:MAG: alpha/beta fold hydrolase [Enterococcus casseliflavus]
MFYGAKGSSVTINGSKMDYVEFGLGKSPLIILPGLSDGLKTVEGQAIKLAYYFRAFLNDFKVYVFSRKTNIENGYTTREMAKDLKAALDQLGIKRLV